MLTDTTFWIDLLDERRSGAPGPVAAFMARQRRQEFHVSVVTWGELAEGFLELAALEYFLRGVRVLPLPQQVVWTGSRLQRQLSQRGGRLGENDTWIAATALTWGKRLVTRDRAFGRVPRLGVVAY